MIHRITTATRVLALGLAVALFVGAVAPARADASATLTERVRIKLEDGMLNMGELFGELLDRVHLGGAAVRDAIDWRVDISGTLGKFKLRPIELVLDDYIAFDVSRDTLTITIDRAAMRRDEKEIRGALRLLMKEWFPDEAADAAARFGVTVHTKRRSLPLDRADLAGRDVVVLVHGLDDPGRLWDDLMPALLRAGFTVCEVSYPNDQAIAASARTLADHLATMKQRGAGRVSIVAHSMGGLISREVLTSPRHYGGDADGGEKRPAIDRLIMVGTPNHGSHCARLDIASELREQTVRCFSGDGLLFGSIFDGAGEARVDLLPESEFLTTLNRRANPRGVKMTIIAGRLSPVDDDDIERFRKLARAHLNGASKEIDDIASSAKSLVTGVGDGVVTLESARLDGVDDYVVVNANHVTMLNNNWTLNSENEPPAVPIILERLGEDRE